MRYKETVKREGNYNNDRFECPRCFTQQLSYFKIKKALQVYASVYYYVRQWLLYVSKSMAFILKKQTWHLFITQFCTWKKKKHLQSVVYQLSPLLGKELYSQTQRKGDRLNPWERKRRICHGPVPQAFWLSLCCIAKVDDTLSCCLPSSPWFLLMLFSKVFTKLAVGELTWDGACSLGTMYPGGGKFFNAGWGSGLFL